MNDKLVDLYLSGREKLCFKLMEGQKIKTLYFDLALLKQENDAFPNGVMNAARDFILMDTPADVKCGIYYEGQSKWVCASDKDETYEVAFYHNGNHLSLDEFLKFKGLDHLMEYAALGHCSHYGGKNLSLCDLPKKHVLEIIFLKKVKDEIVYKIEE